MSLFILLVLLSSACASFGSAKGKRGGKATFHTKTFNNEAGAEEPAIEGVEGEEDDSAELASTEEATPEDLGEVDASQSRQASEIEADKLAALTFPLVQNEFVDQWIRYFSGRGKDFFGKWLARSTRYIPLMKEVLRKEGVPEDLIYLSMIESGFNTKAKSVAKAVGPWQFMKGTGDRYDLNVTYWTDERRDFIKATYAAAKYLKELNQIFGSWYLAAAAYNAGEGKVLMAVRRDRSRNFWELIRIKKNFRAETRNYVPKLIAAALIAKNPSKYGFENIAFEEPFQWETVNVPGGVRMKQVATIIGSDEDTLELLNPPLRRGMTPPGPAEYTLRVPVGAQQTLTTRMSELTKHARGFFVIHKVKRGESLGSIARRYRAEVQEIMDLNNIAKVTRLRVGQDLSIPQSEGGSAKVTETSSRAKKSTFLKAKNAPFESPALIDGDKYRVQSGDTLWSLSRQHNVSIEELKRVNNLKSKRDFRAGILIVIPKKSGSYNKPRTRNSAR